MKTMKTVKFDTTEKVTVRLVTMNRGKREYYVVLRESERNVSGTPLARFRDRAAAFAAAEEHNGRADICI